MTSLTAPMKRTLLLLLFAVCANATKPSFQAFAAKMTARGLSPVAINSFKHAYASLARGGTIPESQIRPTDTLAQLPPRTPSEFALANLSLVHEGELGDHSFKLQYQYNEQRISPWHHIPLFAGTDTADPTTPHRCVNGDERPQCANPSGCPTIKCVVPSCGPEAEAVFRWENGCRGCMVCRPRSARTYHFVCEIPRGSTAKMEIHKSLEHNPVTQDLTKSGALRHYTYKPEQGSLVNYGALSQTWEHPDEKHPATGVGGDNDPIDVLQVNSRPCVMGQVMRVRLLGVLALVDGDETDWKIFVADVDDQESQRLWDMQDVGAGRVQEIQDWFRLYKTVEGKPENRFGLDGRVADSSFAATVVLETHDAWRRLVQRQAECSFGGAACWRPARDPAQEEEARLLRKTVMMKLNGGLGTSMGLQGPKSLLPVHAHESFLDLIAEQVQGVRSAHGPEAVKFMLMNSFATSNSTREFLARRDATFAWDELMQNEVPKIDHSTLQPVEWPAAPELEWCPPGHGDLYVALAASGELDRLIAEGYEYLFVSNADNLGATLDTELLRLFHKSGSSFMMEVCERTASDKKGGHLAANASTGGLLLREVAQCSKEDEAAFQDFQKYKYFNTNNLWIKLAPLKQLLDADQLQLPVMLNRKTVDPSIKTSTPVIQLEVAMGAAISLFPGSTAVQVPRERFTPVKKCSDLLVLRSDVYQRSGVHHTMRLAPGVHTPPTVVLDDSMKLLAQLEAAVVHGVPSLRGCTALVIKGPVHFGAGVVFEGKVTVLNPSEQPRVLPGGLYKDQVVDLSWDFEPASKEL